MMDLTIEFVDTKNDISGVITFKNVDLEMIKILFEGYGSNTRRTAEVFCCRNFEIPLNEIVNIKRVHNYDAYVR